jgi:hypothetical protein
MVGGVPRQLVPVIYNFHLLVLIQLNKLLPYQLQEYGLHTFISKLYE